MNQAKSTLGKKIKKEKDLINKTRQIETERKRIDKLINDMCIGNYSKPTKSTTNKQSTKYIHRPDSQIPLETDDIDKNKSQSIDKSKIGLEKSISKDKKTSRMATLSKEHNKSISHSKSPNLSKISHKSPSGFNTSKVYNLQSRRHAKVTVSREQSEKKADKNNSFYIADKIKERSKEEQKKKILDRMPITN